MATSTQRRGLYIALLVSYGVYLYALFAFGNADAGPPRWLDDIELAVMGGYWTFGSVLLLAVPPFLVLQLVGRRLTKRDELDVASGWLSGQHERADLIWAAAFGVLAVLVSGVLFYRGANAGDLHVLRAADVEAAGGVADLEPGARVEVRGFPARKAIKVSRVGHPTHYVPLLGAKPRSKDRDDPQAAAPPAPLPPAIVVESQDENADFEVDTSSGEVTVRGMVVSAPIAARVAGEKVGLVEDQPVLYVRAGATPTRDFVAAVLVLVAGAGAIVAQLRRKKISSAFDQEVARNEGAW